MPTEAAVPKGHKTIKEAADAVEVAEVRYHDGPLMLPQGMGHLDAIKVLESQHQYLSTKVSVVRDFECLVPEGAHALAKCIEKKFGFIQGKSTYSFFGGEKPPQALKIRVGYDKVVEVPWGRIKLPHVSSEGHIDTTTSQRPNGSYRFRAVATVLRKDEKVVNELFDETEQYLKEHPMYRGQAIKMRFTDDNGMLLAFPEPQFLRTDHIDRSNLIYSKEIEEQIEINLFTPIERVNDMLREGITVKRGVMLSGSYGTGKTLAATVASKLAVDNGITYLYVPRAAELAHAIDFAKLNQSPACVVFCEDIDRVTSGNRDVQIDEILNIIDGIDSKALNLILVLTTNDIDSIEPAMLRPGRLDTIIDICPPDAEAVERLIRSYGGHRISPETDLTEVGEILQGLIPATIAEVINRAKIAQLRLTPVGEKVESLSSEALVASAKSMKFQTDLLERRLAPNDPEPTIDEMIGEIVDEKLIGLMPNIQQSVALAIQTVLGK